MKSLVLMTPEECWATEAHLCLLPGAHVIALGEAETGIAGRVAGFEVRDSLAIVSPDTVRFAFLFRKPCEEATVAAQTLKTGTGAINIDGCRVSTGGEKLSISKSDPFHNADGSQKWNPTSSGTIERDQHPKGRWPTNLVFVHGSGCQPAGQRKIPGHKGYPNGPGGKSHHYSSDKRSAEVRPNAWAGHAGADGLETIASWSCEPGCPVKALDDQSGNRPGMSGGGQHRSDYPGGLFGGIDSTATARGDSGGASRFYPQFKNDAELEVWLTKLVTSP